jgi:hypothetical protein
MGKIYYLDLKTLLETLEGQSCILQREVPKNITRLNENCLCSIRVSTYGQIISCALVERNGRQFDAIPLLPALYDLENWDVTIVPESKQLSPSLHAPQQYNPPVQDSPTPTSNPASDEEIIPYLLTLDAMAQLQSWSHKERLLARTVLLHVDGIRSIVDIRVLLSFSPASVEQTFTLLYQRGIIGFRRRGM